MSEPEWWDHWFDRHLERHPDMVGTTKTPQGLADWASLRVEFVQLRLSFGEAEACTERLRLRGSSPKTHLRRLLEVASEIVGTRAQQAVVTRSREEAERLSHDCSECGGSGLTSRRFTLSKRQATHPEGVPLTCYCHRCPMGRWMRQSHEGLRELAGRIVDLVDYPGRWGDTSLDPAPATRRETAAVPY